MMRCSCSWRAFGSLVIAASAALLKPFSTFAFSPRVPSGPPPPATLFYYRQHCKTKHLLRGSLDEEFGGYTTKQRLFEEVESPFRKVRLVFFASTTGSALTALYFSSLNVIKAATYANADAAAILVVPMDEALSACAVNLTGAIVCSLLALREYRAGQANLERIKKGGQLARLRVMRPSSPAATYAAPPMSRSNNDSEIIPTTPRESSSIMTLKDYRRVSRVVIAVGGRSYLSTLCRQLNSDQLQDRNPLVRAIHSADMVIIPVLLLPKRMQQPLDDDRDDDSTVTAVSVAADTQTAWLGTAAQEGDREFDVSRASSILAFPRNTDGSWSSYLESEIETAQSQGFNVLEKGFTIVVKKNGRILRRATGLPNWSDLIGNMEVRDGSKFGMPGDDARYTTGA